MTESKGLFRSSVVAVFRGRGLGELARALALLPLLLACTVAVAQEMQVIDLQYRRADDVIPVLQPLLESGDAITGMDDKLFVRADPATLSRVMRGARGRRPPAAPAVDHRRTGLDGDRGRGRRMSAAPPRSRAATFRSA